MAKKKKGLGLWAEFKEFINRGNALMLAVGVVIGGAFSAIVNAFVNMLMSLATWPVPGGLAGLVTVLPAVTDGQKGLAGVGQKFEAAHYNEIATQIGNAAGANDPALYGATLINGNYTKYGTNFYFNGSAIINWGALINATISFIIIAIVLFIIVKAVNAAARKKEELKAKAQESYWQKHPEERPVPEEEKEPEPTELDYLKRIAELLEAQNAPAPKAEKKEPAKKNK